jgi:hypothetical protein
MHTILRIPLGALVALFASCSAEAPEAPCCAIEPEHQCRSDLYGAGVSEQEMEILLGPDKQVCPSDQISDARIRELAPLWNASEACRTTRGYGRLDALASGLCETGAP